MNCGSCGLQLPQGAANCPRCGAVTPYNYSATRTTSNDPTYLATPYAAAQQTPPTPYAAPPYGATPPAPAGSPPYGAELQNPYSASPYSALPLTPTPPSLPPVQRSGNRIGIIVGVVVLVLILSGGGMFAFLRYSATRNAAAANALAHAQATATAHAHAQATATAIVALQNPYTHSGTLALSDPLSDNAKGYGWDVNSNCAFTGGTYHAIAPDARYSDYCLAAFPSNLGNFAFEVQMQIIKGDAGGVVFRVENTNPNQLYQFYVGRDGSYYLNKQNGASFPLLTSGTIQTINRDLNQTNLIAVVAQGNLIKLYMNHHLITSITDSSYSHGQIGVVAAPYKQPTEVVFSNVKVWTL